MGRFLMYSKLAENAGRMGEGLIKICSLLDSTGIRILQTERLHQGMLRKSYDVPPGERTLATLNECVQCLSFQNSFSICT